MPQHDPTLLTVYERKNNGDILVYDPSRQPHPGFATSFNPQTSEMVRFTADKFEHHVQRVTSESVRRAAVTAYREHVAREDERLTNERTREAEDRQRRASEYAAKRLQQEKTKRESDAVEIERFAAQRERQTRERNGTHLDRLGITNKEYRKRPAFLSRREAWCWDCTKPLDSEQELEHVLCQWLMCTCGACGCGRPKKDESALGRRE